MARVLDCLALARGLPQLIRTDHGKEFCGKAMLTWAHERGVQLGLMQPSKPNQNADVESFNSRLRDECCNEHGFIHLLHARTVIEPWPRASNEQRPKRAWGGRTPSAYAKQLASTIIHPGLSITPRLKTGGRHSAIQGGMRAIPWKTNVDGHLTLWLPPLHPETPHPLIWDSMRQNPPLPSTLGIVLCPQTFAQPARA